MDTKSHLPMEAQRLEKALNKAAKSLRSLLPLEQEKKYEKELNYALRSIDYVLDDLSFRSALAFLRSSCEESKEE